ncbi:MAG: WD40 repeat domain-containing protein [Planctomycetota bacterium]|nr:WD40 repeat domain-containing protein [Planctomycetota bacterium]
MNARATAIWDANTGKRLHRLEGHRGAVMAVAFSPDQSTLATGSIDGTIKLWDVASGAWKKTLTGHKSWVNTLTYRSNGEWLISGSSDGTVMVWNTTTGTSVHTLDATKAEVRSVAISHDGSRLAAGLRYGTVKIWDTAEWKESISIPGQGDMCAVAFSPNGKLLASTEGDWNRGGFVKIRDAATGNVVWRFQHTGEVTSLSFGKTEDVLAAGAADKTVRVWHGAKAKPD